MDKTSCHCVFPAPTEEELATVEIDGQSAVRVRVESSRDGYVRLEQLAYTADLGWYVQKSFCIPGEVLPLVLTQMRKADCLIPRRSPARVVLQGQDAPLRLLQPTSDPTARSA